jgi:hypothetical protein
MSNKHRPRYRSAKYALSIAKIIDHTFAAPTGRRLAGFHRLCVSMVEQSQVRE